jgi:hypothetical protein
MMTDNNVADKYKKFYAKLTAKRRNEIPDILKLPCNDCKQTFDNEYIDDYIDKYESLENYECICCFKIICNDCLAEFIEALCEDCKATGHKPIDEVIKMHFPNE